MRTYRLSVGELWARSYDVKAQTEQQALEKYYNWVKAGSPDNDSIEEAGNGPEYIEDVIGDVIVDVLES